MFLNNRDEKVANLKSEIESWKSKHDKLNKELTDATDELTMKQTELDNLKKQLAKSDKKGK